MRNEREMKSVRNGNSSFSFGDGLGSRQVAIFIIMSSFLVREFAFAANKNKFTQHVKTPCDLESHWHVFETDDGYITVISWYEAMTFCRKYHGLNMINIKSQMEADCLLPNGWKDIQVYDYQSPTYLNESRYETNAKGYFSYSTKVPAPYCGDIKDESMRRSHLLFYIFYESTREDELETEMELKYVNPEDTNYVNKIICENSTIIKAPAPSNATVCKASLCNFCYKPEY